MLAVLVLVLIAVGIVVGIGGPPGALVALLVVAGFVAARAPREVRQVRRGR